MKSRATTIRLPTAYDDFFARFDSKSAAVRTAVDFYLSFHDRLRETEEHLLRLETSVGRIEGLLRELLNHIETGNPLPVQGATGAIDEDDATLRLLTGSLEDF